MGYLLKTLLPNFHVSSTINSLLFPFCTSESTTKSASAPSSRQPLRPWTPSMAAGVDVTAFRACGTLAPVKFRKLLTHSINVMELDISLLACGF